MRFLEQIIRLIANIIKNSKNHKNNQTRPDMMQAFKKAFQKDMFENEQQEEAKSDSRRYVKPDYVLDPNKSHRKYGLLIAIAVIVWGFSGIRIIHMEQKGVVTRFGSIVQILEPGLHFCLPYMIDTVHILDCTSIRRIDTDSDTILTGDENIASIYFYVLWNIKDPVAFLFSAKSPESTVRAASDSIMREIIAQNHFDKILTTSRNEIAKKAHIELQQFVDKCKLGIEIVEVQLGKVDPPNTKVRMIDANGEEKEECVIEAYREVQRAKADFERSRNEAESYENYIIPESRGQAEKMIQAAQGYKIKTLAQANGQATQFNLLQTVYNKSPDIIKARLNKEYKQRLLQNAQDVIIGDVRNMSPLLNMNRNMDRNMGAKAVIGAHASMERQSDRIISGNIGRNGMSMQSNNQASQRTQDIIDNSRNNIDTLDSNASNTQVQTNSQE